MRSDSSDDDAPLARSNGHLSSATIPKAVDKALDRSVPKAKHSRPNISVPNGVGPEDVMDVDVPVNGTAKRKSRSSISSKVNYKDASEDSDDDAPLAKRQKSKHKAADSDSDDEPISKKKGRRPSSYKANGADESSDDDQPLGAKLAKKKAKIEMKADVEAKAIRSQEVKAKEAKAKKATPQKRVQDDSDDDVPLAKSSGKRQSNGASVRKTNGVKKDEIGSDEPVAKKGKKTPSKPAKGKSPAPAKKGTAKQESDDAGEEEEEEFEWWNAPKREDDSIKWETLEHSGVLFPPPYEPLPKNVKLVYDGIPVNLHVDAEEVAYFFGSMLHSTLNVENPVFQKNFFNDFQEVLKSTGGATDKNGKKVEIKEFAKLDFVPIHKHWTALNEAKKARPAAEKKAEKLKKDELEAAFMYCKWDGRKEKVGNYRVEPPGLFRGRGDHPKTGKVKKRVRPDQVTINIGKDAAVPVPPDGYQWKAVQHDNKATWLAMWQENVNGNYKYVMLAANSAIKGQSDYKKFEKARELKKHIDKIRRDYKKDLKSEVMEVRQRATAVYLIDKFALRAGNEKNVEEEAETVGCCSLKFEHIKLEEPNIVEFDFLGKDSIRYYDRVEVERQVFKNLKLFKRPPKTIGDDIFDRLDTTKLNKHLSSYMPGLTAKVFRTYNASYTMGTLLKELDIKHLTVAEKVAEYNKCNKTVAILCNHKRTVGASHEAQMEKLGDKIKGAKYQMWRQKMMLLDVDAKQKKKRGADYFALDDDLDQEWIKQHQDFLVEDMRNKIKKKFEKDNEKLAAQGDKPHPEKELKERLKAADELAAKYKKENKSNKVEAEGKGPTVESIEAKIKKSEEKIRNLQVQAAERDDNKEVALSTSKINYIDPRLTVVFVKKFDVPIEKFFSKTLREKFNWAIKSVEDANWEF